MSSYLKVTRALSGDSISGKVTFTAKRGQFVQLKGTSVAGKPGVFNPDVEFQLAQNTKGFVLERDIISGDIPLDQILFAKDFGIPDNIRDGADAVYVDAATTSASPTLTSNSALFTQADVGRGISGAGIPGSTTISVVTNSTTITLSANATATATGVTITIANRSGTLGYASARKIEEAEIESASGGDLIDSTITGSTAVGTKFTLKGGKIATITGTEEPAGVVRGQLAPVDAGNVRVLCEFEY